MNIETTIKKAIEGGYDFEKKEHDGLKPPLKFVKNEFRTHSTGALEVRAIYKDDSGKEYGSWVVFNDWIRRHKERTFIDPKFWESLGKAMGWGKCSKHIREERMARMLAGCDECMDADDWQNYWHNFIDHLIEGKSAEDYFKEL